MSAPTDVPNSFETCTGGLPAMRLRRITLPPSVLAIIKTPFRLPPILFFSIKLSLLVPTSPTPKLLQVAPVERNNEFLRDFTGFQKRTAYYGMIIPGSETGPLKRGSYSARENVAP